MPSARLLFALPLLAVSASPLADEGGRPEGAIDADGARVEVLSRPVPVGKRIDLPEGWFRVEEEGVEERNVGSFTVASAAPPAREVQPSAAAPSAAAEPAAPVVPAILPATPTAAPACRAQRNAYLREVWKESGIEIEDPDALLEGLDAGTAGPATGYYWFALQVDPFRSLAWSSELRGLARDLSRCVREARASGR